MRTTAWAVLAALVLCLGAAPGATADDDPLARASKLRDDSVVDWKAKRFAEAAAKLREAAEIYEGLEDVPAADLAVTLRALVWNEKDAGQHDKVPETFLRLMRLVKTNADLDHEVWKALRPLADTAYSRASLAEAQAVLAPLRAAAEDLDQGLLLGQLLHDTGTIARNHRDFDTAIDFMQQAIRQRTKIQDRLGLCWTLNNLANLHIQEQDDPLSALDVLDQAHALVHEERVITPQASVGINIRMVLDKVGAEGGAEVTRDARKWIERIATRLAKSKTGAGVSFGRVARAWIAWSASTGKASDLLATGKKLMALGGDSIPAAVRMDVGLRLAAAALEADKPKTAARWLEGLTPGTGPCSEHLTARGAIIAAEVTARTASKSKRKAAFVEAAKTAFDLWEKQTDNRGRKDAYRDLLRVAGTVEASVECADIQKSLNDLEAEGVPGGPGGFATSSGNVQKVNQLALDDPLFTVRSVEGGLEIADLATGAKHTIKIVWAPKNIGFNGLAMRIFGGYVVVKSLRYGGAASAGGDVGETRLDDLGDYHPVPAGATLIVQKNGAVRYRPR